MVVYVGSYFDRQSECVTQMHAFHSKKTMQGQRLMHEVLQNQINKSLSLFM